MKNLFFKQIVKCFSRTSIYAIIAFVPLSIMSCLYPRQTTFDEVLQTHSVTSDKLTGHRPFYCGSDNQYDYYIVTNIFSSRYKVPTTPHRFFPSPVPFRGWSESNWYKFSLYRGKIVITTLKEKQRLYDYASKLYASELSLSPEWMLTQINEWCIRNWGQDRLRIPYADGTNGEPEWFFLRTDWYNPYQPQKSELYSLDDDPRF